MIILLIAAMLTGIVMTGEPLQNPEPQKQDWSRQIGPNKW